MAKKVEHKKAPAKKAEHKHAKSKHSVRDKKHNSMPMAKSKNSKVKHVGRMSSKHLEE